MYIKSLRLKTKSVWLLIFAYRKKIYRVAMTPPHPKKKKEKNYIEHNLIFLFN